MENVEDIREGTHERPKMINKPLLELLADTLMQLHTYYVQRDDPGGANWCMKVIAEVKEIENL